MLEKLLSIEDAQFVDALYRHVLGRKPDLEDLGQCLSRLHRGVSRIDLLREFISSSKAAGKPHLVGGLDRVLESYSAKKQSWTVERLREVVALPDEAFVSALYRNILGRMPDVEGFAYFLGRIHNGESRAAMMLEFTGSPEAANVSHLWAGLDRVLRSRNSPARVSWRTRVRLKAGRAVRTAVRKGAVAAGRIGSVIRPGGAMKAAASVAVNGTRQALSRSGLRVAFVLEGGIGDLMTYGAFIEQFYLRHRAPEIDVYYPNIASARFAYHMAPFVADIVHSQWLEDFRGVYDLIVTLNCFVSYQPLNAGRIFNHSVELLNDIALSQKRYQENRILAENRPYFDGLFALGEVLQGRNRIEALGHCGNIDLDRNARTYLCPDIGEYSFFESLGFKDRGYITIHDGVDNDLPQFARHGSETKRWPLVCWAEFVRLFKERFPEIAIVQLGADRSQPIAGVDCNLIGKTNLHQAAWILKHSSLHVDGESGFVRVAHSLGTRSVVMFGPTNPDFFRFDQNLNIVSSKCGNCWWSTADWMTQCPRGLPEPECMKAIKPEMVFDAVREHLDGLRSFRCAIAGSELYGARLLESDSSKLRELFDSVGLPAVPISAHAQSAESGLYLHASKQWEYLFALEQIGRYCQRGARLKIADLGGGRGALPAYLAHLGNDVEVFDINYLWDAGGDRNVEYRYIKWAEKRGYRARYGSMFNVPAENDTFDVVTCISVVEHIPHKHYALKEALRILKPGGLLVITFDFSQSPDLHQDSQFRQEIFSPALLAATLAGLGVEAPAFTSAEIQSSVEAIQRDGVLGIPHGMTVGGLTIQKLPV